MGSMTEQQLPNVADVKIAAIEENSPDASEVVIPNWYQDFAVSMAKAENVSEKLANFDTLSYAAINAAIGGDMRELPYQVLRVLLPDGSDNQQVADVLRSSREEYLKSHPDEVQGRGATEGIISYDGRFIPIKIWETLTEHQKFAVFVGSTCTHYAGDVPGYGDLDYMDADQYDAYLREKKQF